MLRREVDARDDMLRRQFVLAGLLLGWMAALLGLVFAQDVMRLSQRSAGLSRSSVTTFEVMGGGRLPADVSGRRQAILQYLTSKGVSLVVAPVDGYPGIWVLEAGHDVPWLPGSDDSDRTDGCYLVRNSYSADLWQRTRATPLLPETNDRVLGEIDLPPGLRGFEFVGTLSPVREWVSPGTAIPVGTYTLGTSDPSVVAEVLGRLRELDVGVLGAETLSVDSLRADDDLMRLLVLLGLAEGCVMVWWWFRLQVEQQQLRIRARHGASPAALVRLDRKSVV